MSKREKMKARALEKAFRSVLGSDDGRLVLRWVIAKAGVVAPSHRNDALTEWREGRRAVGLELVDELLRYDPHALAILLAEEADEKVTDKSFQAAEKPQATED